MTYVSPPACGISNFFCLGPGQLTGDMHTRRDGRSGIVGMRRCRFSAGFALGVGLGDCVSKRSAGVLIKVAGDGRHGRWSGWKKKEGLMATRRTPFPLLSAKVAGPPQRDEAHTTILLDM